MIWEQRWVGRPAGTHFSTVTSSSPLVFSDVSNTLQTHARLGPVIEQSRALGPTALALVGGVAIGVGVTTLAAKVRAGREAAHDESVTTPTLTSPRPQLAGPTSSLGAIPRGVGRSGSCTGMTGARLVP